MNWILSLQPAGLIPISPQSLKTIIYNSTAKTLIPAKKADMSNDKSAFCRY